MTDARPPYTVLRVTAQGVVLAQLHAARLGPAARRDFQRFAATALPGVYALTWREGLVVQQRAGSTMLDGQPARRLPSPLVGPGPRPKPAPPSAYDAVRLAGVTTLLTSPDGAEAYETCRGALLAWDGAALVATPEASPRVASVAEALVTRHRALRRAPLLLDAGWPLLQLNAVAPAADVASHPGFPAALRAELVALLESTASRAVDGLDVEAR